MMAIGQIDDVGGMDAETARAEVRRLRGVVARYGQHDEWCSCGIGRICDCGLAMALTGGDSSRSVDEAREAWRRYTPKGKLYGERGA